MTFQNTRTICNPRKPHRCAYCGSIIPKGVSHVLETGVWENEFYSDRGHHDCIKLWNAAYSDYGDPYDGMPRDLVEAIEPDESRDIKQAAYDSYRGRYPHVICRLELRWQRGDIKARDRYLARGLEPDPEDHPEVYG